MDQENKDSNIPNTGIILDKLIDNFDTFDIIERPPYSNDKIKLYQKIYVYQPTISMSDSI